MGLFYRATDKELLEIRKKIFFDRGLPMLQKNGYEKSPFSTANFGKDNTGSYSYEFCKMTDKSLLQIVSVHIIKGDKWIQISLNIFRLDNAIKDLRQLNQVNGIQFILPPNSVSDMRLHVNDFKGMPLVNYDFWFKNHKLKSYFTKNGFDKSVKKLSNRIERDLTDFDKYVSRWFKLHNPMPTTIEGKIKGLNAMTVNERLYITGLMKQFEEAKHKNKEYATNILKWLEVDELSIKTILGQS
jgi:hypothetical protein